MAAPFYHSFTSVEFVLNDTASMCFQNTSTLVEDYDRFVVGIFILIFSTLSLALNALVITSLIKEWTVFRTQVFTQFVISMILAGILYSLVNFFVSIPCAFNYCPYLSDDTVLIITSFPNTLSFLAYLLANFGFAIYRLSVVFSKHVRQNGLIHLLTLYLPWLLAVYTVVDTTFRGCIKRFNRWTIGYTYNCSSCNVWFGVSFIDVNFYAGQILPIIMCIIYVSIILNVYWRRKKHSYITKSSIVDVKLAFQYLIVCVVQYLASFLFYIVPKFGNGSVIAVTAMNIIGVIDVGLNPLILLIFNKRIRDVTISLFHFRRNKKLQTTRMTIIPTIMKTSH